MMVKLSLWQEPIHTFWLLSEVPFDLAMRKALIYYVNLEEENRSKSELNWLKEPEGKKRQQVVKVRENVRNQTAAQGKGQDRRVSQQKKQSLKTGQKAQCTEYKTWVNTDKLNRSSSTCCKASLRQTALGWQQCSLQRPEGMGNRLCDSFLGCFSPSSA